MSSGNRRRLALGWRAVTHQKRISVDAWISRDASEALDGILTRGTDDATRQGPRGTLTLPWTTINNVRLEGFEQSEGVWDQLSAVQAQFVDDRPSGNIYTLHFFGLELHNPRLTLPVPAKRRSDAYVQTPLAPHGAIAPDNPWYGPIRYRSGYGMMPVGLAGVLRVDGGVLPADVLAKLQQRIGVGSVTGSLPLGYPKTFRLRDAVPELASDVAIGNAFVVGARISWNVEQQSARIMVNMLAQPQSWTEGTP